MAKSSIGRVLIGIAGLVLVGQSLRFAASLVSGSHAGYAGLAIVGGATAGVGSILVWHLFRRRRPSGVGVFGGALAGGWAPVLISVVWAAVDPATTMPLTHRLIFWLMWAGGGLLGVVAPVGVWLLWEALRSSPVGPEGAA